MSDPALFQHAFGAALDLERPLPGVFADSATVRALAVHRNTSAKAAQDALAANYPVLRALTGEESFAACAALFARNHPPREPRLCLYGEGFGGFLQTYAPFADTPYLAEVAALERLYTETLFAADAPPLDGGVFEAGLDLDRCIALHPACRFERFSAPVVSIWLAHQDDAPSDALETLEWRAEIALVVRPGDSVTVFAIDAGALAFLSACQASSPLGVAAMRAMETGAELGSVFAQLIAAGAFTQS